MDVRVYKDENQNPWFVARDVADILDYKNTKRAIKDHVDDEDKCVCSNYKDFKLQQQTILINKRGVKMLITHCRKIVPKCFIEYLKNEFNIDFNIILRYYPKELETIDNIKRVFCGEKMYSSYKVDKYTVDLYFKHYKIVVECDEHNHNGYNKEKEDTRTKYIKEKLGCKFIRYNPDAKDFNIFDVINEILYEILLLKDKFHYDNIIQEATEEDEKYDV